MINSLIPKLSLCAAACLLMEVGSKMDLVWIKFKLRVPGSHWKIKRAVSRLDVSHMRQDVLVGLKIVFFIWSPMRNKRFPYA